MKRVVLLSRSPLIAQQGADGSPLMHRFPSYGVRRVQAALASDSRLGGVDVKLVDLQHDDVDAYVEAALAHEPDMVALSLYVWSTALFLEVARRVKRERPRCLVVLGGPSAHARVLDHPRFADSGSFVDALVLGEGEETCADLVASGARGPEGLAGVAGLALRAPAGWAPTPARSPRPDMDRLASPFQLALMPADEVAYLETFRGCPLSCSFCQWGVMESKRHFSREYLVRELRAMAASRARHVFIVDAALNLNARAFANLVTAESEVRFLRGVPVLCEVYPQLLGREHLAFLEGLEQVHFGVGVQSLDAAVLRTVDRRQDPGRVRQVVEQLSRYGLVDVELILGLPGDTPETFRHTLEAALELPCNVRVYRCLVLPDGLLTRSPAEHQVRYDPETLLMISCHTWTERALRETQEYMDGLVATSEDAIPGEYWWQFIDRSPRYRQAYERRPALAAGGAAGA